MNDRIMTDIIALVVRGKKPLAIVEQRKLPGEFSELETLLCCGELFGLCITRFESPENSLFIIAKCTGLIDEYLREYKRGTINRSLAEYQIVMGRIFGYSEKDIQEFIASPIDCDCSQCVGLNIYTGLLTVNI